METKLNDNEVSEIAGMQRKIDSYEWFIKSVFMMGKLGHSISYPIFTNTDFNKEMNFIWRTIKENCTNESKKDSKAT